MRKLDKICDYNESQTFSISEVFKEFVISINRFADIPISQFSNKGEVYQKSLFSHFHSFSSSSSPTTSHSLYPSPRIPTTFILHQIENSVDRIVDMSNHRSDDSIKWLEGLVDERVSQHMSDLQLAI